ncbi:lanthionine synthetase C family protein [Streptomyces paromomycinus]|uniref:Lanthionine synthetase n=1 Tax=Streptomyces paromomycinus TaxID=92743 RepID=A0A401W456_STREY|nr:lanthionine synthetase C family protein [Streptomyces paromomycinus]GCD44086.1 hypothetical protein GKJPGBOP_03774 [Streptomyces paromomycinus]
MTTAAPILNRSTATQQSLAHGPLGVALLHIERAHRGAGSWQAVHCRLGAIGPLIDGNKANLFLGAPAMAYVLHLASAGTNRYGNALHTLDGIIAAHTRRRLGAAHARIDQGKQTSFAEYDLLRGLTGLGALLLRRDPGSNTAKAVLEYLVRLTEPLHSPGGRTLPGWWVWHGPATPGVPTPGGHANVGLAHGIAGPLALLALAKLRGISVTGHHEAMTRICRWLDQIRQSDYRGARWPRWITETAAVPTHPAAPSWCYGTPGLARAQQLAAMALGDACRQRMAEQALLSCLADPLQLDQLAGRGLCHGIGGLLRVVQRVAEDAEEPGVFATYAPQLSGRFRTAESPAEIGFLEGSTGAALAFEVTGTDTAPATNWDSCLLLA